jgi:hypothetical protein
MWRTNALRICVIQLKDVIPISDLTPQDASNVFRENYDPRNTTGIYRTEEQFLQPRNGS